MNWWVVIFSWLIKCLSDSECFSIRSIVTWIWKVPALYSVQLSTIVIHQTAPARFFYFAFVFVSFCSFVFLYFFHCVAAVGPRTPLLLSLYTSFLIPIQFQEVQQGLLLLVAVTSVSAKLTCYCLRNSMPMVWFLLTTQHQRLAHLKKKRKSVIILSEADYIRLDMDQTVICY